MIYDSFKIFTGLPTTGGAPPEENQHINVEVTPPAQ
jgi:hypothetical protein